MADPLLVLDVNFLCYRAFHTLGELSFGSIKTGVVFGFLREVVALQDRFGTERVAFCFDHGLPKRKQLLPCYKQKRHDPKERTEEEERARQHMRNQVDNLRKRYLPKIGYRNILCEFGYEADDIIASVVKSLPEDESAIVVSCDGDLYQLLAPNVSVFQPSVFRRPARIITLQSFTRDVGIDPRKWDRVKAIAGCTSDEIPGIPKVGEKTAIKYLKGELGDHTKAYQSIVSPQGRALIKKNKRIVRLPLKGTPRFRIQPDEVTEKGWQFVCEKLGLESLKRMSPLPSRAQRRTNKSKASFGL